MATNTRYQSRSAASEAALVARQALMCLPAEVLTKGAEHALYLATLTATKADREACLKWAEMYENAAAISSHQAVVRAVAGVEVH